MHCPVCMREIDETALVVDTYTGPWQVCSLYCGAVLKDMESEEVSDD